jgi:general stress protein 26
MRMSQQHPDRQAAQAKLWGMIKEIKVAMMTSWDGQEMHSRPMHGYQEEFAGKLYFFTKHNSGKTEEIKRYDKINLAYADNDSKTYVSVAGEGHVTTDRALIDRFWNPHAAAWFPKGKDDPDLAVIEVDAQSAQYWDATSSAMVYLFQVASANLTGREPNMGENEKLSLKPAGTAA